MVEGKTLSYNHHRSSPVVMNNTVRVDSISDSISHDNSTHSNVSTDIESRSSTSRSKSHDIQSGVAMNPTGSDHESYQDSHSVASAGGMESSTGSTNLSEQNIGSGTEDLRSELKVWKSEQQSAMQDEFEAWKTQQESVWRNSQDKLVQRLHRLESQMSVRNRRNNTSSKLKVLEEPRNSLAPIDEREIIIPKGSKSSKRSNLSSEFSDLEDSEQISLFSIEDYAEQYSGDDLDPFKKEPQRKSARESKSVDSWFGFTRSSRFGDMSNGGRPKKRRSSALFHSFMRKLNEKDEKFTSLHEDTYSFLVAANIRHPSFSVGMVSFLLQCLISLLLTVDILYPKNTGYPANVDTVVRWTQGIALGIAVLIEDDVHTAIQLLVGINAHRALFEVHHFATKWKWYFSIVCRMISSSLVAIATVVLICEADNVKDLLLNFTAASFISSIDDMLFTLSNVGFFGRPIAEVASEITEKKYMKKVGNKRIGRMAKTFLLVVVFLLFLFGWLYVVNLQMSGHYLCKQLYVQFGDDSETHLSSSSGLYNIQPAILNDQRVSYVEQRSSHHFIDGNNGRGLIAYCKPRVFWSFTYEKHGDRCEWEARSSVRTKDYNLMKAASNPWLSVVSGIEQQMEKFNIFCFDGNECAGEECSCPRNTYGLTCKYTEPCAKLSLQRNEESSLEFIILKGKGEMDNSVQAYHHPIYASYTGAETKLLLFSGTRWMLTSTTYFEELRHDYSYEAVAAYFLSNSFHSSTLPTQAVAFISESVDVFKSPTPLGVKWYYPDYSQVVNYGLPDIETSRSANNFRVACAFCDNSTNPCLFDGKCQSDGSCKCKYGTTGTFCEIVPTANGVCDPYFNHAEYKFDGGDCCGASCSDPIECGKEAYKAAFGIEKLGFAAMGYPNCVDPSMVPITIKMFTNAAHYFRMVLTCNGIKYMDIPPYALSKDVDDSEVVYVKDGADCDFRLTLESNFFTYFSEAFIDVEINYGLMKDKYEIGSKVFGNETLHDSTLLASSKRKFRDSESMEVLPFVVVKKCIRYDMHQFGSLIQYKTTSTGRSLQWRTGTPQGQGIQWLNADTSDFSACGLRSIIGLQQRYQLATLNFAMNNTLSNKSWLSEKHECQWRPGITCNDLNVEELVTAIELPSLELKGYLTKEIGMFQNLLRLDLYDNDLTGTIPVSISNLTNLVQIKLSLNSFTGTIHSDFGKLVNLGVFKFDWNQLNGTIPSELGNITRLVEFDIGQNSVSGTIPSEFGQITGLQRLRLTFNRGINGTIPTELGKLRRLERLEILENSLSGTIPTELFKLTELKVVVFNTNKFIGTIPSQIKGLSKLEILDGSSNRLTGTIPEQLSKLTRLEQLDFRDNNLNGTILSELGLLNSCKFLLLASNQITGEIPSELGSLRNLEILDLHANQLFGTIPIELGNSINLKRLRLSSNFLNGIIASEFGNLIGLRDLDFQSNQLSGNIPYELGNAVELRVLNVDSNQFNGTIPTTIGQLAKLETLIMNNNQLKGTIPTEIGRLTNVGALDLSRNQITGTMPSEIGGLTNMVSQLSLSINALIGPIPSEIGNLVKLEAMKLAGNQLSGTLPSEFGRLTSLTLLTLKNNKLTGSIPSELGYLTNLVTLSIGHNRLIGTIPSELGELINLDGLNLGLNQLTGTIPSELGLLSKLTVFYLYYNQLTGTLFTELGNLKNLVSLKLLNNRLSGSLPSELGRLSNARSMELHANQFSGTISPELGNLQSLVDVNLQGNEISGSIPDGLCRLNLLNRLIIDCEDLECPTSCNCRSVDRNQRHYSCPPKISNNLACTDGYFELRVEIVPDNAPEETAWEVVVDGDPTLQGGSNDGRICIPANNCTIFTIYDLYGDGMCCSMGYGSYTLFLDNQIYYYGGSFIDSESVAIGSGCS